MGSDCKTTLELLGFEGILFSELSYEFLNVCDKVLLT